MCGIINMERGIKWDGLFYQIILRICISTFHMKHKKSLILNGGGGGGGCRAYFRDPRFAQSFLREMWLLLFYHRELWFVSYRDPWFPQYCPRYLWKRPHFRRENDEKFRKILVCKTRRKIESDETVMGRLNIIGINAGAPSQNYVASKYYPGIAYLVTYFNKLVTLSRTLLYGMSCIMNHQYFPNTEILVWFLQKQEASWSDGYTYYHWSVCSNWLPVLS